MTVTAEREQTTPNRSGQTQANQPHEESLSHFLARTGRIVFRWGVLIFLVVTVLTIFLQLYPLAAIPFALFVVNLVMLAVAREVEQRTYQPGDPHDETAEEQAEAAPPPPPSPEIVEQQQVSRAVERRTAKIIAGILVAATFIALGIAAALFDPQLLVLGGLIIFAYLLFVSAPFWLGWLNDEAEEVEHEVEERFHSHES